MSIIDQSVSCLLDISAKDILVFNTDSVIILISNVFNVYLIYFSRRRHLHLSTSEGASEDEDVTAERSRISSGEVADDVLVLQDLTKVRLFAIFLHCLCYEFSVTHLYQFPLNETSTSATSRRSSVC